MTPEACTEVISDDAGLEALIPEWIDLWRRASGSPFRHPDWVVPWWRAFRPGRLTVIAAMRETRLLALAPLYLEHGPFGRRLLPVGISLGDHLDLLVDPADARAGLAALTAGIGSLPDWDRLDLEDLPPGAAALDLPLAEGWTASLEPASACPVLDLSGPRDDDGLPLTVPAKWRRKVRRARRIASDMGGLDILDGGEDPAGFFEILDRLHTAEWEARGEPGVLADPAARAFHRAALPALARAGFARLRIATVGGRVAGAYYGFRTAREAAAYLGGFDADFAAASPGMILIADAVADAAAAGLPVFDFLRGREAYKYRWGASDRQNVHRRITKGGPRCSGAAR